MITGIARTGSSLILGVAAALTLASCRDEPAPRPAAAAPSKVEHPIPEGDLATVRLTPDAEKRLGIRIAAAELRAVGAARTYPGEIVLPPGQVLTVSAPLAGELAPPPGGGTLRAGATVRRGQPLFRLVPVLQPERDMRAVAEKDVASTQARVEEARARLRRAEQLLADEAGSARAVEEARAALKVAEAEAVAAQTRLQRIVRAPLEADASLVVQVPRDGIVRQVHAVPGTIVASGAPLYEIAAFDPVWVRVAVYAGDIGKVDSRRAARVHDLGAGASARARVAPRVDAPPSADSATDTVDLYFELSNGDGTLRPGQRVAATLALRGAAESLVVPSSALVHDVHGGAWIYENTAPQLFVRRRVEVEDVRGGEAILGRGPRPGAKVVVEGAAELFGSEFGPAK